MHDRFPGDEADHGLAFDLSVPTALASVRPVTDDSEVQRDVGPDFAAAAHAVDRLMRGLGAPAVKAVDLIWGRDALGKPVVDWTGETAASARDNGLDSAHLHVSNTHDGGEHFVIAAYGEELVGLGIDLVWLPRLRTEGKDEAYLHRFARRFMSDVEYAGFAAETSRPNPSGGLTTPPNRPLPTRTQVPARFGSLGEGGYLSGERLVEGGPHPPTPALPDARSSLGEGGYLSGDGRFVPDIPIAALPQVPSPLPDSRRGSLGEAGVDHSLTPSPPHPITTLLRTAAHFSLMESASKACGTGLKIGVGMGRETSLPKQSLGALSVWPEVRLLFGPEALARLDVIGAVRYEAAVQCDEDRLISVVALYRERIGGGVENEAGGIAIRAE